MLSLFLLRLRAVRDSMLLCMLAFWFNFMNVANFYCYVPIRTFETRGDIGDITRGLGVSPWLALVVLGTPTALAMWFLFTRSLPGALGRLTPHAPSRQRFMVSLSTAAMFGYFGLDGLMGYGPVARTLSVISLGLVPIVTSLCWPSRRWIKARIEMHG